MRPSQNYGGWSSIHAVNRIVVRSTNRIDRVLTWYNYGLYIYILKKQTSLFNGIFGIIEL